MVRSAALLSPIAYMGQMPSPLARAAADIFLAEVINTTTHFSLATSLPPRFSCGTRFFRVFSHCLLLMIMNLWQDIYWLGIKEFAPGGWENEHFVLRYRFMTVWFVWKNDFVIVSNIFMEFRFFVRLKHVGNKLKNISFLVCYNEFVIISNTLLWIWDSLLNSNM